jgi:hypothetical protein
VVKYLDFRIDLGPLHGENCQVRVTCEGRGCAVERKLFSRSIDALLKERRRLQAQFIASREAGRRRDTGPALRETQGEGWAPQVNATEFGRELYQALFQGEVRSFFDRSHGIATERRQGLRLTLITHDAKLAAIPWELLHSGNEFLCLSQKTPLVRDLFVDRPPASSRVESPVRLLGVLSNRGGAPLQIEQEKSCINRELETWRHEGGVEVHWLEDRDPQVFHQALSSKKSWHIVHFAGHGAFDESTSQGLITVASERGGHRHLRAAQLKVLLGDSISSVRLVFLNVCEGAKGGADDLFSSTASQLIRAGVSAVVAMQFPISDDMALLFAQTVYRQIVQGNSIEEAVSRARVAVNTEGSAEWATPVLFVRSGERIILRPDVDPAEAARIADAPGPLARPAAAGTPLPMTAFGAVANAVTPEPVATATFVEGPSEAESPPERKRWFIGRARRRAVAVVATVSGVGVGVIVAASATTRSAMPTPIRRLLQQPTVVAEGTVDFGLDVNCREGSREVRKPSPKAAPPSGVQEEVVAECSPLMKAFAKVTAQSDPESVGEGAWSRQFRLKALGYRTCGRGPDGSAADVRPLWRVPVDLPDDDRAYDITVRAEEQRDSLCGERRVLPGGECAIVLDGQSYELVPPFPRVVTLPRVRKKSFVVALDCRSKKPRGHNDARDGLVVAGCRGFVGDDTCANLGVSPPSINALVTFSIEAKVSPQ